MKLVFIYGPPAAGKLTVAKELAKLTGYKVFHNHLTVDAILPVFGFGMDQMFKLAEKYRLEMFRAAAQENVDLIYTQCYVNNSGGRRFVRSTKRIIEKKGGKVFFVQLYSDRKILFKRLKSPSRKHFDKLKNSKDLEKMLKKHDFFLKIPFVKSLSINNTSIPPKKAARMIQKQYKLGKNA